CERKDHQHRTQRHQHEPADDALDHEPVPAPVPRSTVDAFTDFLAGLELGDAFLAHIHLLARPRIAPEAGRSVLHREGTESAQLHPVTARHRVPNLAEDGVDDILDVALEEMRILVGQLLYELRLDHAAL